MTTYTKWPDVPAHLKTKTAIKQANLRRRPKQAVIAQIDTTWEHGRKSGGGVYDLFDTRDCLPGLSAEQKAAQAERLQATRRATHCDFCGGYVQKSTKSASPQGLCLSCQKEVDRSLKRRQAVQQWAVDLLGRDCVLIDTETTGLSEFDGLVELAIVSARGNTLLHSLINPEMVIRAEATAIHGITNEMVKDAPRLRDLCEPVTRLLAGREVVIYNANFDAPFLRRGGIPVTDPACLMLAFAKYFGAWSDYHGGWKWRPLDAACAYFEIERRGRHRAEADAQDAAKVLQALASTPPKADIWEAAHH
jgi:DNA polymerase-3 subunit epsilon